MVCSATCRHRFHLGQNLASEVTQLNRGRPAVRCRRPAHNQIRGLELAHTQGDRRRLEPARRSQLRLGEGPVQLQFHEEQLVTGVDAKWNKRSDGKGTMANADRAEGPVEHLCFVEVHGPAPGLRPGYRLPDRCRHIARDRSTEYQPPDLRQWTLEGGPEGHARSSRITSIDPVLKARDGARHLRLVDETVIGPPTDMNDGSVSYWFASCSQDETRAMRSIRFREAGPAAGT